MSEKATVIEKGYVKYPVSDGDVEEMRNRFTYHPPKEDQPGRYVLIRDQARELARSILELTPYSREQALALTRLEESVFYANAAIARRE